MLQDSSLEIREAMKKVTVVENTNEYWVYPSIIKIYSCKIKRGKTGVTLT